MAVELGTAYLSLTISAKGIKKDAEKAAGDVEDTFSDAGQRAGKKMHDSLTGQLVKLGAALGAAKLFKDSIGAASDLGETISKVGVIFGESGKDVQKWADTSSKAFGQSKRQALDAASTFATFGKSAGLQGQELVGFSEKLTTLASDLASFHNTSPEEAIEALGAALRGESEPIRRYGVLLDDASLRQEALSQGLIKTTKEALTPQQKVLASYSLILKQTGDAQGDFERTSDGLANKMRAANAQFEDAKAKLGQALLPIAAEAVGVFSKLIGAFSDLDTSAQLALLGIGGAVAALGPAIRTIENIRTAWGALMTTMAATGPVGLAIAGLATAIGILAVDAFKAAGPLDEVGGLVSKIGENARDSTGDLDAVGKSLTEWISKAVGGDKQLKEFEDRMSRVGITAGEVQDVLSKAGPGFAARHRAIAELIGDEAHFGQAMKNTGLSAGELRDDLARVASGASAQSEAVGETVAALDAFAFAAQKASEEEAKRLVFEQRITQAQLDQAIATNTTADGMLNWVGVLQSVQAVQKPTADSLKKLGGAMDGAADAADSLADRVKALQAAQDEYFQHSSTYDAALDSFRDRLQRLDESIKDNGTSFSEFTKEGRENRDALRQIESAAADVVTQLQKAGGTALQQQTALQTLAAEAYNSATALGVGADEAQRLKDRILGIPTDVDVTVRLDVERSATYQALAAALAAANEGRLTLATAATGGPIPARQLTLVGEKGPELFISNQAGTVIPNHLIGKFGFPALAEGGVVSTPTLAWVGDRGPEAVVPLNQLGTGGVVVNAVTNADPHQIAGELAWVLRTSGR